MNHIQFIHHFWSAVANQNAKQLGQYFTDDACIRWHNTNELFTVPEYIRANCEYPGKWSAEIERIEQLDTLLITVTRVWLTDHSAFFHATSFFRLQGQKISELDEYWGDDGLPPMWRQEKKIGKPIK